MHALESHALENHALESHAHKRYSYGIHTDEMQAYDTYLRERHSYKRYVLSPSLSGKRVGKNRIFGEKNLSAILPHCIDGRILQNRSQRIL
jgi:hypothetical protein